MCGRFTLTRDGTDLMDFLKIENWSSDFTWNPSYNIAPTQEIPVLICKDERYIHIASDIYKTLPKMKKAALEYIFWY